MTPPLLLLQLRTSNGVIKKQSQTRIAFALLTHFSSTQVVNEYENGMTCTHGERIITAAHNATVLVFDYSTMCIHATAVPALPCRNMEHMVPIMRIIWDSYSFTYA